MWLFVVISVKHLIQRLSFDRMGIQYFAGSWGAIDDRPCWWCSPAPGCCSVHLLTIQSGSAQLLASSLLWLCHHFSPLVSGLTPWHISIQRHISGAAHLPRYTLQSWYFTTHLTCYQLLNAHVSLNEKWGQSLPASPSPWHMTSLPASPSPWHISGDVTTDTDLTALTAFTQRVDIHSLMFLRSHNIAHYDLINNNKLLAHF